MSDFWKDIAPTLGGFIGTIGNLFGIGSANAQNAENIERQNQLNVEQWMRENNYNLPINQVQRLRAAGLSPSLMYENGSSGLTAAASPEMQAAHANPLQVDPLTLAQVEKLKAETRSIKDNNDRENGLYGLHYRNLAEDINNKIAERSLWSSMSSLNNALEGKAKQEANNLLQDWQQKNQSFVHTLSILESDAEIKKHEALRIADQLDAAIKAQEAYARYMNEQGKYVKSFANSAAVQADAAARQADIAKNRLEFDKTKWFGDAEHVGESDLIFTQMAVNLQDVRKKLAEIIMQLKENDLFDKTELAKIVQAYEECIPSIKIKTN